MGLPISKTPPQSEVERKPIQAVVRHHCHCTHSDEAHRGADLGKSGGPCRLCKCPEYKPRPCKCAHSFGTHNDHCTVTGCGCQRFEEDMTPYFLMREGYSHWDWRYATVKQLRYLQRPDQVVRVRIWATILIHAAIGKRQRLPEEEKYPGAWLAVKRNSKNGAYEPLQPIDIENELNEINRDAGEEPVSINYRRECRAMEEQGSILREAGARDHVRLFFLMEPKPYKRIDPTEDPDDDSEMRTDLSAFRLASSHESNHFQNEIIVNCERAIVKEFQRFFKRHHVHDVVSNPDRSVRIAESIDRPVLAEFVRRVLFEGDLTRKNPPSVSNEKAGEADRSVTPAENGAFSREKKPASLVPGSVSEKKSVSQSVPTTDGLTDLKSKGTPPQTAARLTDRQSQILAIIKRWVSGHVSEPPTPEMCQRIDAALDGADLAQFVQLIRIKLPKITSLGFLDGLARDCAVTQEAWRTKENTPAAAPASRSNEQAEDFARRYREQKAKEKKRA